jgi:hypothetical protein
MRVTWTTRARLYSTPTVAAFVAAIGGVGTFVAVLTAALGVVRSLEGPLWFIVIMLGFMSLVMLAAGVAAARSALVIVWVDGGRLHWMDCGRADARPHDAVGLMLGAARTGYGYGRLHAYPVSLVGLDRKVLVDDLGGSVFRALATLRLARAGRQLGLARLEE